MRTGNQISPCSRLARRGTSWLLLGLCSAGCASKPAAPPSITDELPDVPAKAAPLSTDGEPQNPRVVVDSVNDTVDRFDQIIRQREQAKRAAADVREAKAGLAGEPVAKLNPKDEAAEIEKLSSQLRERKAIDPIPNPSAASADATAPQGTVIASAANQPLDAGTDARVQPQPSADASGAINSVPKIQVQRGDDPSIARGSSADPMLAIQKKLSTRVEEDPTDLSAQLDLQLSRFLHDEPVPQMSELSKLPPEDRELLAAMCDALSNYRSIVRSDDNALNSVKARPFIDMADRIHARADLTISGLTLCRKVSTFAVYDPIQPLVFSTEGLKRFVVYCEVDGFLSQLTGDGKWETKMSLDLRLYDDHNMQVWMMQGKPTTDLAARRRRDFFLNQLVELPMKMPAGHYMLKARVTDLLGTRIAEQTIQFEVKAPDAAPPEADLARAPKDVLKDPVK